MAPDAEPFAYVELTDWEDTSPRTRYERTRERRRQHRQSNPSGGNFRSPSVHFLHPSAHEDADEGNEPLIDSPRSHAESEFESAPGVSKDAPVGPAPRAVDTAYRGFDGGRATEPGSPLGRSRTLLQRLASLKPARLDPRRDRYFALESPERDHDVPSVDLSSLEGRGYFQHDAGAQGDNPKSLGSGVVVGKEVHAGVDDSVSNTDISVKLDPAAGQVARSATIRKYGQKLAQDTNTIVSVREAAPVDLTSLAGGSPAGIDSPKPKVPGDVANLSYFYPADPEQPNWKPFPMRALYIIMLAIVSLGLAGVQEYLYQKSKTLEKNTSGLIRYNRLSEISVTEFFAWKYLPTIVMVAYGVLWQVTDYDVKRLEPYYQLSQPTGNTAAKSLNLDYVTLWAYFVPFKAIKNRHWAVLVSSVGNILATTAAPSVQNPSIAAIKNPNCKDGADCGDKFRYLVRIQPIWSRLVSACLVVVAIIAIILLFQLRRKSGLLSDPRGVAGIASMATKSHILTDFRGMDESLHDEIHEKLRHRRYILYKSTIWQGEYIKKTTDPDETDTNTKPTNPHPIILRKTSLVAFIIFLIICLPFVPAISFTDLGGIFHDLPWLPILIATLIKQLWATLEFAVKMMEPFHTLSLGNARPDLTLTLDYQGVPYGILPCKALLKKHYLVSLIGACSILGDTLTVTFSSLSLAPETETINSFYASSSLSIGILIILIISATIVFIRRSRRPFMPRQPATIASVLAFIHQSRMLDDFVGTERYTHAQMEELLTRIGKRYGLGWFRGRDARPHCAIDQEPMLSRYVHGVSYVRAQAPWEENVGV